MSVDLGLGQVGIVGLRSKVKVKCQNLAFGARSKVGVKVTGQGQRSGSNFWRSALNVKGL